MKINSRGPVVNKEVLSKINDSAILASIDLDLSLVLKNRIHKGFDSAIYLLEFSKPKQIIVKVIKLNSLVGNPETSTKKRLEVSETLKHSYLLSLLDYKATRDFLYLVILLTIGI